jgi:sigma-B regulation protein RsbU (phosphoserine phosphatase)
MTENAKTKVVEEKNEIKGMPPGKQKNKKRIFKISYKITLWTALFFVLMIISFGFLTYDKFKKVIMNNYGEKAGNAAATVAHLVNVEKLEFYRDLRFMDDEYVQIVKNMDYMRSNLNVTFLYVLAPIGDDKAIFIYDTSSIEDSVLNSKEDRELLGNINVTFPDDVLAHEILSSGENTTKLHFTTSQYYGNIASSYAPVINSEGKVVGLVGVDVSIDDMITEIYKNVATTMLIVAAIVIVGLFLALQLIERTIVGPLKKVKEAAVKFAGSDERNLGTEEIIIKNRDEIGELANSFNKMMKDTRNYVENMKKITIEKEQVSAELSIANEIQRSMLPRIFPAFPNKSEFDIYAVMCPAKEVGGDFYDFFMIDATHLVFVISDVAGKGVSAALFMSISKILIKNRAHEDLDPAGILFDVNNQLCMNNELGMFTTAFIGVLDIKTGEVKFSNAGHTIPLVKKVGGSYEFINVKKHFVLGGMPNVKYNTQITQIKPGDIIFLYTDGITEALNSKKELFTQERLRAELCKIDSNTSLKRLAHKVKQSVDDFASDEPQADDITILVLKYNG